MFMKTSSGFITRIKSLKNSIHGLLFLFLIAAVIFTLFELSSLFSLLFLPPLFLILPGYFFAKIIFKKDDLIDQLLIGHGLSILNSIMVFYFLLFLYNRPIDAIFAQIVLVFVFFECFALILIDYIGFKKIKAQNFEYSLRSGLLFVWKNNFIMGLLLLIILLGQILLIKIHLYWPDEHTYVYTSRNLLSANYSFTPLPPVMDPRLWTPRYVFIGLNTVFYMFFGLNLTAPQTLTIISSLMLVLVTFALARTLYSKKVGLIAGLYIAFNPIFWWIVRRVVPDMIVATLLWSGIYFMIKACKNEDNGPDFRWQYIPISGLFFGLAVFVKLTVIFLIPTFLVILLIFRRSISKKRSSIVYMILLAGSISFFGVFLASERYTEYLFFLLRNYSYFLDRWDWNVAYTAMIEPLLIISPVFIFGVLGIYFDFKYNNRGKNAIILFTAWVTYFFLPLILPDQAVDPRHVFPAHVGPSIIAAFGTIEVTKRRKLWERMLYLLPLAQLFYETWIREYVRISQLLRFMLEIILVILLLVVLRKIIQRIKKQSPHEISKSRTMIILGLILILFINGHTLNNLGWSNKTRPIQIEILYASQTALELSGSWLNENTIDSSILMTNEFIRLPYYANFRTTYPLPENEYFFLQDIQNRNIDYLVLFWSIWSEKYPYMYNYIEAPPPKMDELTRWRYTAQDGRELGFVIYKLINTIDHEINA